jgi:hypothetical protein
MKTTVFALLALFAVSAHAECITKYGTEYCAKETPPPKCITSDGKEFCQKDAIPVTTPAQHPQAVYAPVVTTPVPVYYAPTYYPYYYGYVGPAVVVRFGGGGHHRR